MWRTTKSAADSSGGRLPEDSRLNRFLVESARDGDYASVERLLNARASPEAGQVSGYTALGLAVNRGHVAVIDLLLRRGASPDTPITVNDATPLMISVVWDRRAVLKQLLAHGCSIEARGTAGSYRGCTALDVARQRGRTAAAELITRERASRRLRRLARCAPAAGRFALALGELFVEVHYRPGGEGERQARRHFDDTVGACEMVVPPTEAPSPTEELPPTAAPSPTEGVPPAVTAPLSAAVLPSVTDEPPPTTGSTARGQPPPGLHLGVRLPAKLVDAARREVARIEQEWLQQQIGENVVFHVRPPRGSNLRGASAGSEERAGPISLAWRLTLGL